MSLDWSNERYVRVYTRNTAEWCTMSWQARALLLLLLREVDRAGVLSLDGMDPAHAIASVVDMPIDEVSAALPELTRAPRCEGHQGGPCVIRGGHVIVRNFTDAQEATSTPAERKRRSRARAHAIARAQEQGLLPSVDSVSSHVEAVDNRTSILKVGEDVSRERRGMSRIVTETRESVTSGHDVSPRTVPYRAVLNTPPAALDFERTVEGVTDAENVGGNVARRSLPSPTVDSGGIHFELEAVRLAAVAELGVELPSWRRAQDVSVGMGHALDDCGGDLELVKAVVLHNAELVKRHLSSRGRHGIPPAFFRRMWTGDGWGASKDRYIEASRLDAKNVAVAPDMVSGQRLTEDERKAWFDAGGGLGGNWAVQDMRNKATVASPKESVWDE